MVKHKQILGDVVTGYEITIDPNEPTAPLAPADPEVVEYFYNRLMQESARLSAELSK